MPGPPPPSASYNLNLDDFSSSESEDDDNNNNMYSNNNRYNNMMEAQVQLAPPIHHANGYLPNTTNNAEFGGQESGDNNTNNIPWAQALPSNNEIADFPSVEAIVDGFCNPPPSSSTSRGTPNRAAAISTTPVRRSPRLNRHLFNSEDNDHNKDDNAIIEPIPMASLMEDTAVAAAAAGDNDNNDDDDDDDEIIPSPARKKKKRKKKNKKKNKKKKSPINESGEEAEAEVDNTTDLLSEEMSDLSTHAKLKVDGEYSESNDIATDVLSEPKADSVDNNVVQEIAEEKKDGIDIMMDTKPKAKVPARTPSKISFGTISVREYARTLGEHVVPADGGYPLGLSHELVAEHPQKTGAIVLHHHPHPVVPDQIQCQNSIIITHPILARGQLRTLNHGNKLNCNKDIHS